MVPRNSCSSLDKFLQSWNSCGRKCAEFCVSVYLTGVFVNQKSCLFLGTSLNTKPANWLLLHPNTI